VAILSIALSPDGTTISSGNRDSTVSLWDIEKGKVVAKWKGHTQAVRSVCWSPSGERVVSGGWDGTARVWDVKSGHGKPVPGLNPIETGHRSVLVVNYSPKGTKIATGGDVHEAHSGIKIWDASGSKIGQLLYAVGAETQTVWSLAWTSDEKKLISGFGNGLIQVFSTATWKPIHPYGSYNMHHGRQLVRAIIVSRNGRLFVSTSSDGTACLWDLASGRTVDPPLQHKSDVKCAAFSADGKLLTTTCADKTAYVWDVQAILKEASLEYLLSTPDISVGMSPTVSH
jgi:WD40 repeat protein